MTDALPHELMLARVKRGMERDRDALVLFRLAVMLIRLGANVDDLRSEGFLRMGHAVRAASKER